jgi:exodeoxyribonuclease VIII
MSAFQDGAEGVYFDLAEDTYRAATGVNISALKSMGKSPAHYLAQLTQPKSEPTPAMVFGTLLHRAALEPHRLEGSFAVKPDGMTFVTKEGKAWRDAQTLPIITGEQNEALKGAAVSVASHPAAAAILDGAKREVSVFRRIVRNNPEGLLLKGRLDIVAVDSQGATTIGDIKTTEDASPEGFAKSIAAFGYAQQAAYYMDLLEASFFLFIAVEKVAPYAVGVYCLDAESIALGREKNTRQLDLLEQCQESGIWPAYSQEIETITLPRWAK